MSIIQTVEDQYNQKSKDKRETVGKSRFSYVYIAIVCTLVSIPRQLRKANVLMLSDSVPRRAAVLSPRILRRPPARAVLWRTDDRPSLGTAEVFHAL